MVYWIVAAAGIVVLTLSVFLDGFLDELGPEWLSGVSVGAFLAAFGISGAVAWQLTQSHTISTGTGVVCGVGLGAVAGYLTRTLAKDSKGATFTQDDLIGCEGVVVSAAPKGSLATVRVTLNGQLVSVSARCDEDVTLGQPIRVSEAHSATMVTVQPR